MSAPRTGTDAGRIYRESLVWDDHCGFDLSPDAPLEPLVRPWREAGVGHLSVSICFDANPWARAIENLAAVRRRLQAEAPYCLIVSAADEIDKAREEGKLAITFDIEGMNALDGRLDMVQLYYELGVRHMLVAYNRNNAAGSGCHDEDGGLTRFGRDVIDEMNRVGMVVDCSHTGFRTTMEAMERSRAPVVFSHSNPRALVNHGRNITDEQIEACAETGGVVGITGINLFLGEETSSPATVARHAAHVAEIAGPRHVGISLDFAPPTGDGGDAIAKLLESHPGFWPEGSGYDRPVDCLHVERLPEVAEALADVGFSGAEIAGALGGNFRRVAGQVWR